MCERVVGAELERMPNGVAKVEDVADAEFVEFVLGDNVGFELHAAGNDVDEGLGILREQFFQSAAFEVVKEGAGAYGAVFDDFSGARAQFASGEGLERGEVAEDEPWLGEGAHDVFDAPKIDGHLAANARVYGREQGGGHLDEGDAPAVHGRGEAPEVPHDAAP